MTGKTISSNVTPVNEILTIAAREGVKGSNYASYKVTFTSAKQVKLTQLKVAFGQNLTTSIAGAAVSLTSEENGGTVYATGLVPAGLTVLTLPTVSLDVIGTGVYYINVAVASWAATTGNPYVYLGLNDLSYNDVFDNLSVVSHNTMLTAGYKSAMTSISDLGINIE